MRLSEIKEARYYRDPEYYDVFLDGENLEWGELTKQEVMDSIRNNWEGKITNWQETEDGVKFNIPAMFSDDIKTVEVKAIKE